MEDLNSLTVSIASDLPSKGFKLGFDTQYLTMKSFNGVSLNLILKAIEEKNYTRMFEALWGVCDFDVDALTIPDAMFLIFVQRIALSDVSPLRVVGPCKHPVFIQEDESEVFSLKSRTLPIADTRPCNTPIVATLEPGDNVAFLDDAHDTFDLPRVKYVTQLGRELTKLEWVAAHLGRDHIEDCVSELESQPDLRLWMSLSSWAQRSRHGLKRTVRATCPVCARDTDITWDLNAEMFLL